MKKLTKSEKIFRVVVAIVAVICAIFATYLIAKNNLEEKRVKETESEYQSLIEDIEREYLSQIEEQSSYIYELESKIEITCTEAPTENEKEESVLITESRATECSGVYNDTGFRSYMPYTAITDRASAQWRIVRESSANEYGLMTIDDIPLVAVGTGWGFGLTDVIEVTTTNGSFLAAVADFKSDAHTDSSRKVTTSNGCVIEFIVDTSCLSSCIRSSGNVASLDQYSGYVLSMEKIGSI